MGQKINPLSGFFDIVGQSSSPTPGDLSNIEDRVVTLTESTQKYLILQYTPKAPNLVQIEIQGAVGQYYGDDFTITSDDGGKRLSWSGLGLDGLLATGDKIVISYPY